MKMLFLLLPLWLVAACSAPVLDPTSTPDPPTEPPLETASPIPPTQTPTEEPIEYGEVTFDGVECNVSGPDEVPPGIYTIVLNNMSAHDLRMGVVQIIDGKTYQDVVDLASEPDEYIPFIPFITYPFFFTYDHETYTYYLDEAGEHYIAVQDSLKTHNWLCKSFQVLEAPPS